jgi:hypothetical protein
MGVCLFLALAEYLAHGSMPLMILDDVLMSVDHGHRRAVARLLRDEYPDCQFVITTHDRVWFRQLQSLGVVRRATSFEIKEWTIDEGPVLTPDATDMLEEAERSLAGNDVPRSAHLLRRAVESHFRDICDGLGALVRYKGDGEYGAGDFIMPAISRLKELLSTAKHAATSWGRLPTEADDHERRRAAAARVFAEENWAINVNVHFNEWANFTREDFTPVVEAYKSVFEAFTCPDCRSAYWVTEERNKATGLRCACGRTNMNLVKKSDTAAR